MNQTVYLEFKVYKSSSVVISYHHYQYEENDGECNGEADYCVVRGTGDGQLRGHHGDAVNPRHPSAVTGSHIETFRTFC